MFSEESFIITASSLGNDKNGDDTMTDKTTPIIVTKANRTHSIASLTTTNTNGQISSINEGSSNHLTPSQTLKGGDTRTYQATRIISTTASKVHSIESSTFNTIEGSANHLIPSQTLNAASTVSSSDIHASSTVVITNEGITNSVGDEYLSEGSTRSDFHNDTSTISPSTSTTSTTRAPVILDICQTSRYTMLAGTITVQSPGVDKGRYPRNVNCDLQLAASEEMEIKMQFGEFRLEYHPSCNYDFLEISVQEDELSFNSIGRFCGAQSPGDTTWASVSSLRLKFVSDSIVTSVGFRIILEVSKKAETAACKAGRIQCVDHSLCIPGGWICDGEEDCPGGSDEKECDVCSWHEFRCGNNTCLPLSRVCDDKQDCDHGEDEQRCVRRQNTTPSVLNLRVAGSWFPVCADSMSDFDLQTGNLAWACSEMGFGPPVWALRVDANHTSHQNATQYVHLLRNPDTKLDPNHNPINKNISDVCHSRSLVSLTCKIKACGHKASHLPQPYVLGSTSSVNGQWPWTVAIFTDNKFKCGATLISDRWILTASHCVYHLTASPQNALIKVGDVNIESPDVQQIRISGVILHPDNNYIYKNDIALVRLAQTVQFSANQRPACLPIQQDMRLNSVCYVAGWGVNVESDVASEEISPILHHAKVKLWPQNRCHGAYPGQIRSTMICAGYEHGEIDACKGDSGGPLMCRNDHQDIWTVEGVVSWGEGCGTVGKPGVYTKVSSYLPWITTVTDPSDTNVTCSFETSNMCGYDVLSDTDFLWTRRKAVFYYPTRPDIDHTLKSLSGHYAYAYAPYGARYLSTVLSAPDFDSSFIADGDVTCLRAYVTFTQCEGCRLVVRARDSQSNKQVNLMQYSSTGRERSWTGFEASLPTKTQAVSFVAITDKYTGGGIGLDDVTVTKKPCPGQSAVNCSFDEGHLCQYSQDTTEEFDWRWNPANGTGTVGHITVRSDEPGVPSDKARIVSPSLPEGDGYHCLSFRFRRTSEFRGSLQVCRQIQGEVRNVTDCNVWTSQGLVEASQGEKEEWRTFEIPFPALRSRYRVVFQATRGTSGEGGLHLDDIRLWSGDCDILR